MNVDNCNTNFCMLNSTTRYAQPIDSSLIVHDLGKVVVSFFPSILSLFVCRCFTVLS